MKRLWYLLIALLVSVLLLVGWRASIKENKVYSIDAGWHSKPDRYAYTYISWGTPRMYDNNTIMFYDVSNPEYGGSGMTMIGLNEIQGKYYMGTKKEHYNLSPNDSSVLIN